MGAKENKPVLSVVDLGLRDVGVKNDPRRHAAHFAAMSVPVFVIGILSIAALCVIVSETGADAWILVPFGLAWIAGAFLLTVRTARRSPPLVVKITADGPNHLPWLFIAPVLIHAGLALLVWDPVLLPLMALMLIMALLAWRGRGRLPEMLRRLRPLLATDEVVLGDGIGIARGGRNRRDALRLVVATDRRLLVASSSRSAARFLLVDVPYRLVSRFGIDWRRFVQTGQLSLTAPALDGGPSETQVIDSIAPGNLLSLARALQAHGVAADDPAAVSEAVREWEEAQARTEPRTRLLDRASMSTREFDRGLWLLLVLAAFTFYVNPFGVGLAPSRGGLAVVLAAVLALSLVCGYVSGTRSSLAYVAPLNLLLSPAFFFADAGQVLAGMLVLSSLAAAALWAGSALRQAIAGRESPPAEPAASPGRGLRLIRISAVMITALVALVVVSAAAGFELSSLGPAAGEVTAKRLRVDGRSNLTGNAASLTYTPVPDLREFIMDENWDGGPNDGARWELRSSFTGGYNVVSLAHYIFEPRLDDEAAVAEFVAGKDDEHAQSAGHPVDHSVRVVDGRRGYVWTHRGRGDYWLYAAWFPHPVHSIRVECVAKKQADRFKRLCAEAMRTLKFN